MLLSWSVVSRLIKTLTISAHILPATGNLVGPEVQRVTRAFKIFARAAGAGPVAQLIAPFFWLGHELGVQFAWILWKWQRTASTANFSRSQYKAYVWRAGRGACCYKLFYKGGGILVFWATCFYHICTDSYFLFVDIGLAWISWTQWICTVLKKRPLRWYLDYCQTLSKRDVGIKCAVYPLQQCLKGMNPTTWSDLDRGLCKLMFIFLQYFQGRETPKFHLLWKSKRPRLGQQEQQCYQGTKWTTRRVWRQYAVSRASFACWGWFVIEICLVFISDIVKEVLNNAVPVAHVELNRNAKTAFAALSDTMKTVCSV